MHTGAPLPVSIVWLKRDLRVRDHAPLLEAARRGPVCVLQAWEPGLWQRPELDASHLAFVRRSLEVMEDALAPLGGRITHRTGRILDILDGLRRALAPAGGIGALWSHQETGLGWTFGRDRAVARWCREHGIPWHEAAQDGVSRPHPERDGWASRWTAAMSRPIRPVPSRIQDVAAVVPGWDHQGPPRAEVLGMGPTTATHLQEGGLHAAEATLDDFLADRVEGYRTAVSSPLTAWGGCSRLSVHLAWGTLSTRVAWQRTRLHLERWLTRSGPEAEARRADLEAFEARLRWRGHFMQKLEDEPALEFRNGLRAMDGIREPHFDEDAFRAWAAGRTGWPMVDACMRSLKATKWLNFRMRAMLVSIAVYPLFLHWRRVALHLAPHFLDFEPGIHFPQVQMQAGTMGINRLRIYDPDKQARDHDPEGRFIRRWLPELRDVPDAFIHTPHAMPAPIQEAAGCRIGRDYPAPLTDHRRASLRARRMLEAVLQRESARREARRVHQRHGSRMPRDGRRWR